MAGNMDERVVSMEFDNRNFEKNVRHSMKTIEDLKESLDFDKSSESLDELDKKFRLFGKNNVFKDVDESCSSLRKGMRLLGDSTGSLISQFAEITKITAMFEMAEKAVRSLESAIKQFTIAPISEGFNKYTTKIGAIKTISNATKLGADIVNDELERLNWFTDETSASFGNMVENIGKFTSVGRGLNESITAMQGIATWGYQSGAGVQEINRAMYNLSQALGTGSVKLMDWKSIENAGMATEEFKKQAIAAAEAAGKLKRKGDKLFTTDGKQEVTTANFNATLQKGWFTSDVLMSVLETYGGFATELRQYMEDNPELETAKDAMYAMDDKRLNERAKVFQDNLEVFGDRAGMTAEQVQEKMDEIAGIEKLKDREKAIEDFAHTFGVEMSEVRRINEITDAKSKAKEIDKWAKSLGISTAEAQKILDALAATEESLGEKAFKSSQQSKSLTDAIEATKDAVSTGWMNTFQKIFGGLEESIELWSDVTDILWDLFAAGADMRNNAFTHWAEEFAGREDLWGEDGIMHSIMDTIIALKDLFGSSVKNVFFKDLEKILGAEPTSDELADETGKNGEYTVAQLRYKREGNYFGNKIKGITTAMKNFGITIRDFVNKNMEKFGQIFESVAAVAKFFGHIIGSVFSTIGNFINESGIIQDILNILTEVGNKIREVVEKIQASGFITKILTNIGNTLTWFYNTIKKWIGQIGEFFEETGIAESVRNFFKKIGEFFLGGEGDVDESGKKTESAFFRAFGWLGSVKDWIDKINFKEILYGVKSFFDNFGTLWSAFTGSLGGEKVDTDQFVKNGLPKELKGVADAFATVGEKLSGVVNFFKGIWEGFTNWLETSGILPTLRNWWDGIKTFFGNIGLVWEVLTTGKVADPKKLDKKQKDLVNGVVSFVKKISGAWNKVKTWFAGAWEWIKEKWGLFTNWLETSGILPKIREIWQKIKDFFGSIGTLWKIFVEGQDIDPSTLSDSERGIVDAVRGFFDGIKETWYSALGWLESSGILPTIRDWWEKIKGFFEEVWNSIGDGSIFQKVGDFFADLWSKFLGLFGGGGSESVDVSGMLPEVTAEGGGGEDNSFFGRIAKAFTDENGNFNLLKGIAEGITGLIKEIGGMDWTSISANVFGVFVSIINGLDDACADLHIDNIIAVIQKVVGAFTGVMIMKTITDITSTIRTIVKKGKDKSLLEKFTDLLATIGSALLQIGISVALIAGSVWLLSKINDKDMGKAIGVLIGIAAFFGIILVYAAVFANNKNMPKMLAAMGSAFLQIGIAVGLISLSIIALSILMSVGSVGSILAAVGLVAAIMIGMVLIIKWMSKITGGNMVRISAGIAVFAGMAILLATITVCLILLQGVNWGKALIDLVLLVAALAAMVAAMKFIDKVKISAKAIAMMIIMAAIIAIITAAFLLLKDMDQGQMAVISLLFIGILAGLVAAILVLQHVNPAGAVKAALAIGLFITAICAALAVGGLIISAAAKTVISTLVSIMTSLNAAGVSAGGIDRGAIMDAIDLLDDIVAAFATVTTCDTTTALKVASDTWTFLNRLKLAHESALQINVDNFEKIFGKDGSGGILASITTALSSVTDTGENAKLLGSNLEALGNSLQLVGESGLALTRMNLDSEGNQLGTYESGIQAMKERMGDIQEIVRMATSLGTVDSEGTLQEVNLTTFAEGIANIGAALQLYNTALQTFLNDKAAVEGTEIGPLNTENIRTALQTVMSSLTDVALDPTQRAEIEGWATLTKSTEGGESTTAFALGLTNIANSMSVFSKSAADFDNDNVSNAIAALGTLADIYVKVKNPADYTKKIEDTAAWKPGDEKTEGTFANAIVGMGNAMSAFGKSVKDIPHDSVTKATTALDTLAEIYNKLSTNGAMIKYFTGADGSFAEVMAIKNSTIVETFTDFGEGIGKIGDAMSSFGKSVGGEDANFDIDKVTAAVGLLNNMADLKIALEKAKIEEGWWNRLWFGDDKSLTNLGENIGDLSAYLVTFQNNLSGDFNLDVNEQKWKNISGVLSYFVEISQSLNNLASYITKYYENGNVEADIYSAGYTLDKFGLGIQYVGDGLKKINDAFSGTRWEGEGGKQLAANINSILTTLKDITVSFSGLKEGQFYDLDAFGYDIDEMFDELVENGFVNFFEDHANFDSIIDPTRVQAFMDGLKTLAEATSILHNNGVTVADILNLGEIINQLSNFDNAKGDLGSAFSAEGTVSGASFVTGFVSQLLARETEPGYQTITGALLSVLTTIESYEEDFREKGIAAGEAYADGFNTGLTDIDNSSLTPVYNMDDDGTMTASRTGSVADMLVQMNLAKSTDIADLATRLDTINNHFINPIKVDDGHADITKAIGDTNDKLKTISESVSQLHSDVYNLKVYMDTNRLVGAIAPAMNRKLGSMANMSP